MFNHSHYVPVLKTKEGELGCLGELSNALKDLVTPIMEVLGPNKPDAQKHYDKLFNNISKKWGTNRNIFLDFHLLKDEITNRVTRDTRPAKYLFDNLREAGVIVIPVTSIMAHREYQEDVKQAVAIDNKGLCIRLEDADWMRPDLEVIADKMLEYFNVDPEEVDLVIDLKDVLDGQSDLLTFTIKGLINNTIPFITNWRTLTITGTSFPLNLSGVAANSVDTTIHRVEWQIWKKLWNQRTSLARMPSFGDYTVLHSQLQELEFKAGMNRSAQIRYTVDSDWLIIKGKGVKQGGYTQSHVLSRLLVEMDEYAGMDFSWGDNYIYKCSRNEVGPGNPGVWRKVENSHHITLATDQLSNYRVL